MTYPPGGGRGQAVPLYVALLAALVLLGVSGHQFRLREELRHELERLEEEEDGARAAASAELDALERQVRTLRQELEARGSAPPPPPPREGFPPGAELTWILERARREGVFLQSLDLLPAATTAQRPGPQRLRLALAAGGELWQLAGFVGAVPQAAPTASVVRVLVEGGAAEAVLQLEVELLASAEAVRGPLPSGLQGLPSVLQGAVVRLQHQLDRAWAAEDWPEVLAILAQLALVAPQYPALEEKFYAAHYNEGARLEAAGERERAIEHYSLALARRPSGGEAQARLRALAQGGGPAERAELPPLDPTAFEFIYIVQPGETLFFIATSFGTTPEALLTRNHVSSIQPGQRLIVRPPPGTEVVEVASGETLPEIAARTGQAVGYLMAVNRLETLTPPAGLKLLLIPPQRVIVYRLQPGEAIPDIAVRYGTTPDAIRRANRMDTLTPPPGTVLYVPLA